MSEVAAAAIAGTAPARRIRMQTRGVEVFYGAKQALFGIDLDLADKQVTALIGPSGCGKSTFLRCLNRMNDTIDACNVSGEVTLDGRDIYSRDVDVVELRARIGMGVSETEPVSEINL